MRKERIAIVPGSFDPITYGHLDVVKRALKEYDRVVVAVMINPAKQYLFSIEERTAIAQKALLDCPRVEVVASDGMLWQLAKEFGACAIAKGYRNQTDYDYEMKMARFNTEHNPDAPTVLYQADPTLEAVSSTVVRERISQGLCISQYLPLEAEKLIRSILEKRK